MMDSAALTFQAIRRWGVDDFSLSSYIKKYIFLVYAIEKKHLFQ